MSANHYLIELLDPESCVQANGYKFMGEDVPTEMWARQADLPGLEELQLGYRCRGVVVNNMTVPRQQNVCIFTDLSMIGPVGLCFSKSAVATVVSRSTCVEF